MAVYAWLVFTLRRSVMKGWVPEHVRSSFEKYRWDYRPAEGRGASRKLYWISHVWVTAIIYLICAGVMLQGWAEWTLKDELLDKCFAQEVCTDLNQ